jgi:hypothetical protein
MITLRCTLKLLKKLRIEDPGETNKPTTSLGDWYANILFTRQGHFILCASEKSLLPIVLSARDLDTLVTRFREQLIDVLIYLGVPNKSVENEIRQMSPFAFGRTKSKVVLGSLNDFAYNLRYMLPLYDSYSLIDWSLNLAEMPCGPLKYRTPIQVTHELLGL